METLIYTRNFRTGLPITLIGIQRMRAMAVALFASCFVVLSGCSAGSSSKPQMGPIAFTDVNGRAQTPLTSMTVGTGTYLDVVVNSDTQLLGADWTVACGSALPPGTPLPPGQVVDESCGTFTPVHTMTAPVPSYAPSGAGIVTFYNAPASPPKGGTVTLYASATGDHSRFSSVTLTINGLPIGIGFAPVPPSSLRVSGSTALTAVVSNDYTPQGVKWTVTCNSSACGSLSATQTASGIATTYTAPASVPAGNTVTVTATSITDPTKSVSATITIQAVMVTVAPATLSVATNGTGILAATVVNDIGNAGVDWTVSCTNPTIPNVCGSVTPAHTASGAAATYTAPNLASIPVGNLITVSATSTADRTASGTATVTTLRGMFLSGQARAASQPLSGASVSLAMARDLNTASISNIQNTNLSVVTDSDGNFSIPYGYVCPSPNAQMYLMSSGGSAGAGVNPNLTLMAALGPCANLDHFRVVLNEATSVAAVFALAGFMNDVQHVGSNSTSPVALANAFTTANDLVDSTTGEARVTSPSGKATIPQAKINSLANTLSACAETAGARTGEHSPCALLFATANIGATPATAPTNTLEAVWNVAHHAVSGSGGKISFSTLYWLGAPNSIFQPALEASPTDWALGVHFNKGLSEAVFKESGTAVDSSGNIWVSASDNSATEFVGAAPSVADPKELIPIAIGLQNSTH